MGKPMIGHIEGQIGGVTDGTRSRSGVEPGDIQQILDATEPSLVALRGASLLITGGTGWIGTWLLDALCAADDRFQLGLQLTVVSRRPHAFLERCPGFADDRRIRWIAGDVRSMECGDAGYSHVIHAAADTTAKPGGAAPSTLVETIIDGTRRTLAAAGPGCKGFLFLSSGAVYGPGRADGAGFSEADTSDPGPVDPRNAYAEGKRTAEQLCAFAAQQGIPTRIARGFAFVGPHMPFREHFAIGNFIADAVEGRPILIKSDGMPRRTYMYMTDLVRALLTILVRGRNGRAYNVGSDATVTIAELARRVNEVTGGRGIRIEGRSSDARDHYVPDTTRVKTELGFFPTTTLETAIARTAAWYRAKSGASVPSLSNTN